ncbi:hypothetical protein HZF24_10295 [Sedimentibacter hydroxybenzoicus DSM 7310]|uniref:Uncharacterized protein n=1 Tax=Sedimentibacter hydroxybenzoicus DSM 7310 TaxID=1123245 RepID=A0A974BJV8_SEDHY|nr:hypothetical protein [Sedimentibacter hydroxybenzoicus]NYB74524.1 hypothetical protein [Sedimentibacter hydroxybenzoicus DSM 7310]
MQKWSQIVKECRNSGQTAVKWCSETRDKARSIKREVVEFEINSKEKCSNCDGKLTLI